MKKFKENVAILLVLLVCCNELAYGDNCDWEKIGKLGAGAILDQIPLIPKLPANIPSVGGTLNRIINLIPSECAFKEIKKYINTRINEERQRTMGHKFKSFKDTLENIRDLSWESDPGVIKSFYMDLNNEERLFMKNNLEDAVIYFRDYANLKIQVIKILIKLQEGEKKEMYKTLLRNEATEFVKHAKIMEINIAPKPSNQISLNKAVAADALQFRSKIRKVFGDSLKSWEKLCECVGSFEYENTIKDGSWVALKQSRSSLWASCWVSGSVCKLRNCPGKEGKIWHDYWKCRGEKFLIHNNKGDAIKNCDVVGIQYSYQNGKGYWLSNWYTRVHTQTCPGKDFSTLRNKVRSGNSCYGERWTIEAPGKACGEKIMHKDYVYLKGHTHLSYPRHGVYLGWYKSFLHDFGNGHDLKMEHERKRLKLGGPVDKMLEDRGYVYYDERKQELPWIIHLENGNY